MMSLYIESIGLAAPGLAGWQESQAILQGRQSYKELPLEKYKPRKLPANERRRATELVRLAFRVCEEAVDNTLVDETTLGSVFATSGGDNQIIDNISRALCREERAVSPTQFHNSVHNSAAGYWSIATNSQMPSTSLSSFDTTFAAGLLEAATFITSSHIPTMFATYDTQQPVPLLDKRPITIPFGAALLLSPIKTENTIVKLDIELGSPSSQVATGRQVTSCQIEALEKLRLKNPAARILPLLEKIAVKESAELMFETANAWPLLVGVSL